MMYQNSIEQALAEKAKVAAFVRLASVTRLNNNGEAYVKFYGDGAESAKLYPYIDGYKPTVGDKVAMLAQGNSYIILGKIATGPITDAYLTRAVADLLYAAIGHNHNGVYSPVDHNHNGVYSPVNHNHDGTYAPASHNHSELVNGSEYIELTSGKAFNPKSHNAYTLGTSARYFSEAFLTKFHGQWQSGSTKYIYWNSANDAVVGSAAITLGSSSVPFDAILGKYNGDWHSSASHQYDGWLEWNGSQIVQPSSNNKIDLGSSSRNFYHVYANQFYQAGAAISTSDRRKKKTIKDLAQKYVDFFKKLRPVSYKMKDGESGRTHLGFIAQEVEQAMTDCSIDSTEFAGLCIDKDGRYGLRYEEFIALQTKVIQDLLQRVEILEEYVKGVSKK